MDSKNQTTKAIDSKTAENSLSLLGAAAAEAMSNAVVSSRPAADGGTLQEKKKIETDKTTACNSIRKERPLEVRNESAEEHQIKLPAETSTIDTAQDGKETNQTSKDDDDNNDAKKKAKAAMIKTVKSLSKDPLVQLSMLRAMEKQNAPAEQIESIKLERDKALKQRASKKKATAPDSRHKTTGQRKAAPQGPTASSAARGNSGGNLQVGAASRKDESSSMQLPLPNQALGSQVRPDQLLSLLQVMQQSQSQLQPQPQPQHNMSNNVPIASNSVPQRAQNPMAAAVMQLAMGNPGVMQLLAGMTTQGMTDSMNPTVPAAAATTAASAASKAPTPSGSNSKIDNAPRAMNVAKGSGGGDSKPSADANTDGRPQDVQLRIPCRARGMPVDHNFQTAHFVIPDDVTHGQDLICSYPACRDSGVKFRFCLFCRLPVARRNFRLRHYHKEEVARAAASGAKNVPETIRVTGKSKGQNHSNAVADRNVNEMKQNAKTHLISTSDNDGRKVGASAVHPKKHQKSSKRSLPSREGAVPLTIQISKDNTTPVHKDSHYHKTGDNSGENSKRNRREEQRAKDDKKRKHRSKKSHKPSKRKSGDGHDDERRSKRPKTDTDQGVATVPSFAPKTARRRKSKLVQDNASSNVARGSHKRYKERSSDNKITDKRMSMWVNLLGKRPPSSQDDDMSKWLMNVMAVSDLKAPLTGEGDPSSSPSTLTPNELGSDSS